MATSHWSVVGAVTQWFGLEVNTQGMSLRDSGGSTRSAGHFLPWSGFLRM